MLTNIDLDEALVAQAMRLTGARSKRELVDRALRELVARATRRSVRELFGIGGVQADYDPKAPSAGPEQAGQFRVEQPRASFTVGAEEQPDPKKSAVRTGRRASATKTAGRKRTGT